MISDENLAQLKALLMEVLEGYGFRRPPSKGALRTRKWRTSHGVSQNVTRQASKRHNGSLKRHGEPPELPEWLPMNHWSTYLEMRTRLRKPASARAQRMLIGRLSELKDKGFNPTQILAQAELNCWLSFYEPKP